MASNNNSNNNTNKNVNINKNTNINVNKNTNVNVNKNTNVNVNKNRNQGTYVNRVGDDRFRRSFGRDHIFRMPHINIVGSTPFINVGGIGWRLRQPCPQEWAANDPLFIDEVEGSYYLCNRLRPRVRILVSAAQCDTCIQAPAPADCGDCQQTAEAPAEAPADGPATLTRGMTIPQVVAALGTPKDIIDLGLRQIYLYDQTRVTFYRGRMSDAR